MADTVVIYHKADFDGIFCREIAKLHFGDKAEYIGWDYGDPVPECVDSATWAHNPSACPQLYMLDISIDELMSYPGLVWIDHHKTAIDKYGPQRRYLGIQIDGVAACRLAWQYFCGKHSKFNYSDKSCYIDRALEEPLAVRLAGEYDIWDKRDPRVDLFQLGLKAQQPLLDGGFPISWAQLLGMDEAAHSAVQLLVERGDVINAYKQAVDAELINAYGFDLQWEGLTFLAFNTARCNSLSFEAGVKQHHDALLGFRYDGKKYTVSLYGIPENRPDLDLSVIASKYGGGGHKHACGFQCGSPLFLPEYQAMKRIDA